EVKIAPSDTSAHARILRAVNTPTTDEQGEGAGDGDKQRERRYDVFLNRARDRYNATGFGGKIYGVCALVRRDLLDHPASGTSNNDDDEDGVKQNEKEVLQEEKEQEGDGQAGVRVRIPEYDLEGRVQILSLPTHHLIIINVYAVNGTTNPYRSPQTGKVVGNRHSYKRKVHEWLHDECLRYRDKGWNTILAGDLNIALSNQDSYPQLRTGEEHVLNRQHFQDLFLSTPLHSSPPHTREPHDNNDDHQAKKQRQALKMRDSFREFHGDERKYTYRPRGRVWGEGMDRVDLILVSEGVVVRGADILDSEAERGRSDHCPLWVEVEVRRGDNQGEECEQKTSVGEEDLENRTAGVNPEERIR
ncbi:MAG: hypothetical protein Q9174_004638, partial [Haloplaca sp. 1 TL-2023]